MYSMTGYGHASGKVGKGRLYIELKTVNHRYCDVSMRLPSRMGSLEIRLRDFVQERLHRGKIDLFLKEMEPVFGSPELELNVDLAKKYLHAIRKLQKNLKIPPQSDPLTLMGVQNFVSVKEKEGNYAQCWGAVQKIARQALANVDKMRLREGAHLAADQKKRLKSLQEHLAKIEKLSRHDSGVRRAAQVMKPSNGNGGETNLSADKMDVTEEVTRLKSHAAQYTHLLKLKEPVGRRLDFLIQEMHREVNTIGAKACNAAISSHVVECKALMENLREQVQNIE